MYMSIAERNERLAVGINEIPSSVSLDVLASLPFEDQPDSEINASLYQQKGQSYYSIFVVVTKSGMLQRALDFVKEHGGQATLHPVRIFLEAMRGRAVRLPRQFVPEMLNSFEPSKFKLKACEIPFDLAVMTFLTDQHSSIAEQREEYGFAVDETGQRVRLPLTRAQKNALAADREADRLKEVARLAVFHKRGLEERQRDVLVARQGALPATDEEAIYEFSRYTEIEAATRRAYLDILAYDRARERAELAHEIVLLQDNFNHDDYVACNIQHTMIYPTDGTTILPFPPTELADPASSHPPVQASRRWKFAHPLSEGEELECTSHITDVLLENGYHQDHFTITYTSDADKERYLQIAFGLTSDYFRAQSLNLTWKAQPLELSSSTAPLPPHMTVLRMEHVLGFVDEQQEILSDTIERTLSRYVTVENVWREDRLVLFGKELRSWNGNSIVAVASFKPKPDGELYKPEELPGWFYTRHNNNVNTLLVLGRAPVCITCTRFRRRQIPKYHAKEQCTSPAEEHEDNED
ncbi:hypothetical protein sr14792 [Sporisorium reilianum SRZ2]|uniref:Uncharacterized protein n=1 Tax=Sporisorium reilianum (strain SRZ2) TaxID=999809 RepID=E6ZMP6_SPORE|nr:hypothetical protein sr14792 [Sporisorium reilianum SRZ2]